MEWLRKKRIKWAFRMGRIEHKFGRLISIPIMVNIVYSYIKKLDIVLYISLVTFICWVIYLGSHTIEKKLFGKHGPRTGWKK